MAKKDDLLIRVETLTLPGELKEKLNLLISRCPEDQLTSIEILIENHEIQENESLKAAIKVNPTSAKQKLHHFERQSNELVSKHISEQESTEAEISLNQDLHEL